MTNPESAVISEIEALVDAQLAQEPSSRTHTELRQTYCACGRSWHGLPTEHCPGTHEAGTGPAPRRFDYSFPGSVMSIDPFTLCHSRVALLHDRLKATRQMTRSDRSQGSVQLLAVTETDTGTGAQRVLGYVTCHGLKELSDAYNRNPVPPICPSAPFSYRLNKLAADGFTVQDSRPITQQRAAELLLDARMATLLLMMSDPPDVPEILAHFREHPSYPPGSSRKTRRQRARQQRNRR
ncbi:hypothetical protein AWB85_21490 [Mycobacteroides immunogenum]|uniref:Uncharacterized protein n=1 Tax=Mycobacteroides immunogenum TaxID=83262 RepID=A0A179VBQ9_9MYCO|nr:hypothetical protein [Mycobacteroides immunogenum]OAT69339.1 hypothetical protein AWB85_21490 [Mycobacteroides immunogenum]